MSKTKSKLAITENIGAIKDGTTGEELQALLSKAAARGLIGVHVSVTRGYSSYDSYDYEEDNYDLVAIRPETDEEYEKRLDKEKCAVEAKKKRQAEQRLKRKASNAQREEKDRKLFEKLKKKFMPSEYTGPKSPFQG